MSPFVQTLPDFVLGCWSGPYVKGTIKKHKAVLLRLSYFSVVCERV